MSGILCIAGPLPPPRHGVSAVNETVLVLAQAEGLSPVCFNTAPASLDRSLWVRVGRIGRIWEAIRGVRLHARRNGGPVYLSLSGGLGLIWEALLAWQARRHDARVIVHHHSFRYLDRSYWPMWLLVRAAGENALHVVLSPGMGQALKQRYAGIGEVLALSNAAFVGASLLQEQVSIASAPQTLGLLANLSAAKGLDDFLDLAELAKREGLQWQFRLAGPFENPRAAPGYLQRIAALDNITYAGPLYGEAKEAFFRSLDVFVFPTRYVHEAEPLTVLEAMRAGKPVIAFGRGCISEMLGESGTCIPREHEFAVRALAVVCDWQANPKEYQAQQQRTVSQYQRLHDSARPALDSLLKAFSAPHG